MHSHRLGKSVQCSSDPEFVFSNVPQKCIKKWEIWPSENNISAEKHPQNLELNYILVGTSVRKQNNLQILLTGYGGREHFTISNDNSSVFTNVPQSLQMFLSLYKCSPIFANVPQSLQMFLNLCKCSSVFTNVPQSLQMFPNLCKCSSGFRDPTFSPVSDIYYNTILVKSGQPSLLNQASSYRHFLYNLQ